MAAVAERTGEIELHRTVRYGDARRGLRPFRDGDVLLAKITPSLENGKIAVATGLANGHGLGSTEFHVLRPRPGLEPRYLMHFLLSGGFRARARQNMKGTAGQLRVPARTVAETQVPLPSLARQREVTAILDRQLVKLATAETTLGSAAAKIARMRRVTLSTLFASFAQRVRLGDVSTLVTSGSRGWAKYYATDGALFLRIANLERGSVRLDLRQVQHVQPPLNSEGTRTRVRLNDILVSITADLGMVALVDSDLGEAYINQHVALLRPGSNVNAKLLAWFLVSPEGQSELRRRQRGATKIGLGLQDIRDVLVPVVPKDQERDALNRIEELVSIADHTLGAVRAAQRRSHALKAAIYNHVFATGGLAYR